MPRKKATGKRTVNKSQFVREQPTTMTAKQVVGKAKDAGITLSEKYVYNIRAKANARRRSGRPGRPPKTARGRAAASSGGLEGRLIDLALELGLGKAEALLGRLRSKIREATLG